MKKDASKSESGEGLERAFAALLGVRETLHAAVVSAGMTVLAALLEEERTRLCGPRYAHDVTRTHRRHGHASGRLPLGGRSVTLKRPRVRDVDGKEVTVPLWEQFASRDALTPRAVEQVMLGVSMRNDDRSLEPAPAGVRASSASKSAVSRRFVAATKAQLAEMMGRDLAAIPLAALILDGIHVGDHVVLVAIGVAEDGTKHVLGLHEGATENGTACKALLEDLVARGLRSDRALLVVIDGSKALAKAVRAVFGERALVQRCQVHKKRNVTDHLPDDVARRIGATITAAYRSANAERAKRMLEGLARQLEKAHPAAAASLREGLDETLTVMRLGLTAWLARTLSTTNMIEFVNGRVRIHQRNVHGWTSGEMVLRWTVAALNEATKTFRKLRGHKDMPKLVAALRAHDAKLDSVVATPKKAA